jgi:hypothetical protein
MEWTVCHIVTHIHTLLSPRSDALYFSYVPTLAVIVKESVTFPYVCMYV